MRGRILYVLMALAGLQACGMPPYPDGALAETPIEDELGAKRFLIVCTGEDDGVTGPALLGAQYALVHEEWEGMLARDVVMVWLRDASATTWRPEIGVDGVLTAHARNELLGQPGLRSTTECGPGKRGVSLIGKDRGLKQFWSREVSVRELFAIIDAMPMRQSEMRGGE